MLSFPEGNNYGDFCRQLREVHSTDGLPFIGLFLPRRQLTETKEPFTRRVWGHSSFQGGPKSLLWSLFFSFSLVPSVLLILLLHNPGL